MKDWRSFFHAAGFVTAEEAGARSRPFDEQSRVLLMRAVACRTGQQMGFG